jgi:NAD-dependent dihydropyrimidine dehydrogenase PreA subunit
MEQNTERDVYRRLQRHMDKMPIGFPETKSGVELNLLKDLFTPREAEIALHLKFGWFRDLEPLNVIHGRFENEALSIHQLEKELDRMAKKGLILCGEENGKKFYGNSLFIIGLYEQQVNKLTKGFLKNTFQYLNEGFGLEVFGTKIPQLRIVPVEESLSPEHHTATYDEIMSLMDTSVGPFTVQNCVCRQAMDLLDHTCKKTDRREVCLGIGPFAEHYISTGLGREINKTDAIKILKQNEKEGLILQVGNSISPHFVCSCCGCCCPLIKGTKNFPRPVQFFHSNYHAEVNEELCIGCEICVKECQMNAIKIKNQVSTVNLKKCIGCGNCVAKCPEEAIHLYKRDKERKPPNTMEDLYDKIKTKKTQLRTR